MSTYTAEDFEDAIACAEKDGKLGDHHIYDGIAFAALRIAARVMDDRKLYRCWVAGAKADTKPNAIEAMRDALTEENTDI